MIDYHDKGMRYWGALKLIAGARFVEGLSPWDDGSEVGPLIDRLVNGDWHATGRPVIGKGKEPSAPAVIRADLWEFLKIYPEKDSAAGGGVEFVGVRFHSGGPPDNARGRRSGEKPLKVQCIDWAREQLRQSGRKLCDVAKDIAVREGLDLEYVKREARRGREMLQKEKTAGKKSSPL